jgi:hypothetical protein
MVGELIVAHEITMAAAVANLKRILAVCGDRRVYIDSPLRFTDAACCGVTSHCTHRQLPDFALKLLIDLERLHKFIEGRLSSYPSCEVISAGDLLAAKFGASPSKVMAAYSGWGAVHGNGVSYTRMALTMFDKVLSGTFKKPQTNTPASVGGSKRKRAESGSSAGGDYQYQHRHSGPSRRHSSADRLPLFTRGGSRGGGRGGNPICSTTGKPTRSFATERVSLDSV